MAEIQSPKSGDKTRYSADPLAICPTPRPASKYLCARQLPLVLWSVLPQRESHKESHMRTPHVPGRRLIIVWLLWVLLATFLPTASATSFTITYDANASQHQDGVVTGSLPTSSSHASGSSVAVAANSGNLARQGFTFAGWNTLSNGSGTTYPAGTGTFTISGNITLYAKWDIPASARLIGAGGEVITLSDPNNVATATCESSGIRGITTDGEFIYFRPSLSTSHLCKSTMSGVLVRQQSITGLSTSTEQRDLAYSAGCVFLRASASTESSLQCIDVNTWSVHAISLPESIPSGGSWLLGNLIDFPDGRIGAVSSPNQSMTVGNGAGQCPSGFYCKILKLFTPSGSGSNVTLTFSENIVLADHESSWPNDDHGIATDGTYLYQTRHLNGYKVWALRSGLPSYLAFNGDGSGACAASTSVSGTKCVITYPVNGISGASLGNTTFMTRTHTQAKYLMGDYSGPKFYISSSATPPPGPGTVIPDTPTITTQPSDTATTAGITARFSLAASSTDSGSISYQWQESTTSTATFQNLVGATSDSLTVMGTSLRNGAQYRVVVGNTRSEVTSYETSTVATLTVNAAITLTGGSALASIYGTTASSAQITASGGTGSKIFTIAPSLTGVSINASTGVVTAAAFATPGSYSRTITATDRVGATATQSISITVGVGIPEVTLSLPGAPRKGINISLTATTSVGGVLQFLEKGRIIAGCNSVSTSGGFFSASLNPYTATCMWRPKIHGPLDVKVVFAPTSSNYGPVSLTQKVVVLRRSGARN